MEAPRGEKGVRRERYYHEACCQLMFSSTLLHAQMSFLGDSRPPVLLTSGTRLSNAVVACRTAIASHRRGRHLQTNGGDPPGPARLAWLLAIAEQYRTAARSRRRDRASMRSQSRSSLARLVFSEVCEGPDGRNLEEDRTSLLHRGHFRLA